MVQRISKNFLTGIYEACRRWSQWGVNQHEQKNLWCRSESLDWIYRSISAENIVAAGIIGIFFFFWELSGNVALSILCLHWQLLHPYVVNLDVFRLMPQVFYSVVVLYKSWCLLPSQLAWWTALMHLSSKTFKSTPQGQTHICLSHSGQGSILYKVSECL